VERLVEVLGAEAGVLVAQTIFLVMDVHAAEQLVRQFVRCGAADSAANRVDQFSPIRAGRRERNGASSDRGKTDLAVSAETGE